MTGKKAVYYICNDEKKQGLVSQMVWDILNKKGILTPSDIIFDGRKVMMFKDAMENIFYFVPTEIPICWDYSRYLPEMNKYFSDCDMAGMVTWHEGASAPPKVLTIHSIGDVNSGIYAPINPVYMRNLLRALERNRVEFKLDEYKVVIEATHWSGNVTNSSPQLILQYPVPIVDIEVGSVIESWTDSTACTALANALIEVFNGDGKKIHNILCVGGVHFDPNFAEAALIEWDEDAFGISHIIANQWLVTGQYEGEQGIDFITNAVEAIEGGIEAIAFHDKMKGCYKDLVRSFGDKYNVPILKHQRLRNPKDCL